MHVLVLEALLLGMTIYPLRKAQIAALKQNKAPTKVLNKYSDFANVFSEKKALMLLEQTNLNKYAIELERDKHLPYRPIYSLRPIKLKTLKTYIKTYLKTGFIWPSKSSVGAFNLFDKKPDNNFCLCINY